MIKEKKTTKMDDDCGGIKPYNPIKPPKKTSTPKKVVKTVKKGK